MKPLRKRKRIILQDAFPSVQVNDLILTVSEGGHITISSETGAPIILDRSVSFFQDHPPAKVDKTPIIPDVTEIPADKISTDAGDPNAHEIGAKLSDGWIVMGVSPDTGDVFSAEPVLHVLKGYQSWHSGENRAHKLRKAGHDNARQPSPGELSAIYNHVIKAHRNHHADFNTSTCTPYGVYWGAIQKPGAANDAWVQYMDDGRSNFGITRFSNARVRCVRDEPALKIKG